MSEPQTIETSVEDHLATIQEHLDNSDADQDVYDALTAVTDKVNSLALGAETDAAALAHNIQDVVSKADATTLHVELTAVKDTVSATNKNHTAIAKLEAILAKVEAWITKEI